MGLLIKLLKTLFGKKADFKEKENSEIVNIDIDEENEDEELEFKGLEVGLENSHLNSIMRRR